MLDSSDIALCLNCLDDLINKTYSLDDFFCIPLSSLTQYYEWPTLEDEVTRFSNLHVALNQSHEHTQRWMRSKYRTQLPSRRHKFCVALSGISRAHSLYLLRPDELLCEQTPFFTIVCVNLSLRSSNKKIAQAHFHLHSHVVKKMATFGDGSETQDAVAALDQIERLATLHPATNFGGLQPPPPPLQQPLSSAKKRPAKAAPSKGIRMDEPPPAKKSKPAVLPPPPPPTLKIVTPPGTRNDDVVNNEQAQSTSFVRFQRGHDGEPVFFDIGGAKTTSFDLRVQSAAADSDDFVLTIRTAL